MTDTNSRDPSNSMKVIHASLHHIFHVEPQASQAPSIPSSKHPKLQASQAPSVPRFQTFRAHKSQQTLPSTSLNLNNTLATNEDSINGFTMAIVGPLAICKGKLGFWDVESYTPPYTITFMDTCGHLKALSIRWNKYRLGMV